MSKAYSGDTRECCCAGVRCKNLQGLQLQAFASAEPLNCSDIIRAVCEPEENCELAAVNVST